MRSLTWVSLQSGVLDLDTVSHRDWLPGALWGNSCNGPWLGNKRGKDVRP